MYKPLVRGCGTRQESEVGKSKFVPQGHMPTESGSRLSSLNWKEILYPSVWDGGDEGKRRNVSKEKEMRSLPNLGYI